MNKYNVWNKWGKLKTVMLGSHYTSEFFKDIKNDRIRSSLQKIADETQEDLEYYEKILKEFGCNVLRPSIDNNDSIMNYINQDGAINGSQGVPRSPLQVRDHQFVAGNTLYYTGYEKGVKSTFDQYNANDQESWYELDYETNEDLDFRHFSREKWDQLAGDSWGDYNSYLTDPLYFNSLDPDIKEEIWECHRMMDFTVVAPSITVVGRDLYIDCQNHKFHNYYLQRLASKIPNIRINTLHHGGHSDGCFHTLKPGAILSLEEIQYYNNTFPNWDVCFLPDQSWSKVKGFLKLKDQVRGKWWVPGEEENNEFTNFVETWLQSWVGYVEETVFDVNVLVLDEHHVCVNNLNPTVVEFLKKHNMEPVHVPWRHRYFWDGGLHCITLDLEREGKQEDYFPERGDTGILDHGFD